MSEENVQDPQLVDQVTEDPVSTVEQDAEEAPLEQATETVAEAPTPAPVEAPVEEVTVSRNAKVAAINTSAFATAQAAPTPFQQKMRIIEQNLSEYARLMAPTRMISEREGQSQQLSLARTFKLILGLNGNEFTQAWGALLNFIDTHSRTLFSPNYAYRFFDSIRIPGGNRQFERLYHLAISTANRGTRQLALRQVDLLRVLSGLPDTAVQQRLQEFYSV